MTKPIIRPSRLERLAYRLGIPTHIAASALVALALGIPGAALLGWTLAAVQLPAQPPATPFAPPIAATSPDREPVSSTPEPARTREQRPPTLTPAPVLAPFPTTTTEPAPSTSAAEPTTEPTASTAAPTPTDVGSSQAPTPLPSASETPGVGPPTAPGVSVTVGVLDE